MLIVGLGNPGKEYEKTRHNVGFWCLDKLAKHFSVNYHNEEDCVADVANFKFNQETNYLLKPLTYMNNSGEAVFAFSNKKNILPEQILVIEDDINLPLGKVRLRSNGSAGGHNGLKSIISKIGENFWRFRIGVGQPKDNVSSTQHETLISHVLGEISTDEAIVLDKIVDITPELVEALLSNQGNKAMNKFNSINFDNDKQK